MNNVIIPFVAWYFHYALKITHDYDPRLNIKDINNENKPRTKD